jgi:hypothetical protein
MAGIKLRIVQPEDAAPKLPDGSCLRRKFCAVLFFVFALILVIVLHSFDQFHTLLQT